MPEEDLVELKFRLYDGSDIGPFRYSPTSTVAMLKERIVTEWPKGSNLVTGYFVQKSQRLGEQHWAMALFCGQGSKPRSSPVDRVISALSMSDMGSELKWANGKPWDFGSLGAWVQLAMGMGIV
ncbi:Membrane-anchored ubiquitin-fold protein 4 [Vitis vinifera]|uniref:Membrane-anchored ubiquitin-fold protein 4 n=1 Tax=Vitis vinifera TaxID=29760 RepID=A0A438EBY4_VITVI|nr:Membrane-anchored ubiquitin-fold protein 4 [Vitis vinifera]